MTLIILSDMTQNYNHEIAQSTDKSHELRSKKAIQARILNVTDVKARESLFWITKKQHSFIIFLSLCR